MLLRWFITKTTAASRGTAARAASSTAPEPHPVERARQRPRQPGADPEVGVGVERGDDLAGVAAHPGQGQLARQVLLVGGRVHRPHHLGVVDQAVDEHLSGGALEGADLDVETAVDLVDHPLDAAPQEEAHSGDQEPVEGGPGGQPRQHHDEPEGQVDRGVHALGEAGVAADVSSRGGRSAHTAGAPGRSTRPKRRGWWKSGRPPGRRTEARWRRSSPRRCRAKTAARCGARGR